MDKTPVLTHNSTLTNLSDKAVTTFRDQRVIKSIESRTAKIEFASERSANPGQNDARAVVTGIKVKTPGGTVVREISTGLSASNSRYIPRISVTSNGTLLEGHDFVYDKTHFPASEDFPRDFFGYPNGNAEYKSSPTVINPATGEFNTALRPVKRPIPITGAMSEHCTSSGLTTSYRFETSGMDYVRRDLFGTPVDTFKLYIGSRLKSITDFDSVTMRHREREFTYHDPMCDIDFDRVSFSSFVSVSGSTKLFQTGEVNVQSLYTTTVTFHDSSLMPGFPIHDASIHYGKVEERVTGTGLDVPMLTVYEYDTSPCRKPFTPFSAIKGSSDYLGEQDPRYVHTTWVPVNATDAVKQAMSERTHLQGCFTDVPGHRRG